MESDSRVIFSFVFFFFSLSMLYLELQGLAGENRYEQKRSRDWRAEMSNKKEE